MRFLIFTALFIFPFTCTAQQAQITDAKESPLQTRLEYEEKYQNLPFLIIPHKPNYLLPFSYNDKIQQNKAYGDDSNAQRLELEFQISFKIPLLVDIAESDISLYFAYSQVSFWQAYNVENSSPFRETNYEPELFALWDGGINLGAGWVFKAATLGLTHQSNGRSEPLSRSWNRLEGRLIAEHGNLVFAFNPWYRFKEDTDNDNNPDLLDYYGHGEIALAYKLNAHTFSVSSRNNIESRFSKGSVEASWSFPIYGKVRGYFKVFSGYGNSLIEYNQYTNTVGLGVSMADWF